MDIDSLSAGKRAAIAWAKANHLEWRYVGGSTIEVHFPGDDYVGYDRARAGSTWKSGLPYYRAIYDETYTGEYEFVPPSAEFVLAMMRPNGQ